MSKKEKFGKKISGASAFIGFTSNGSLISKNPKKQAAKIALDIYSQLGGDEFVKKTGAKLSACIIEKFIFSKEIIKKINFEDYFYNTSRYDEKIGINDIKFDFAFLKSIDNEELKNKLLEASEKKILKGFVLAQIHEYASFINYDVF